MNLADVAGADPSGDALDLCHQSVQESRSGIAFLVTGGWDDLFGACAVVTEAFAEGNVYVKRERPALLAKPSQIGVEI